MGQKVHPKAFRLNTVQKWNAKWFSRKNVPQLLQEDVSIRDFLMKELREASVDKIDIDRTGNAITVIVYSGKPGFIIGRQGTGAEELKKKIINKCFKNKKVQLQLNIVEIGQVSLSAGIAAVQAALEIEKRMPFRRVQKQVIERAQKAGALGVKIRLSGRLGGAEIARAEVLSWGNLPLQNLRADIDYAERTAYTVYGTIGVKVWIYKGEVFEQDKK